MQTNISMLNTTSLQPHRSESTSKTPVTFTFTFVNMFVHTVDCIKDNKAKKHPELRPITQSSSSPCPMLLIYEHREW